MDIFYLVEIENIFEGGSYEQGCETGRDES